jgi:hypothetical protein
LVNLRWHPKKCHQEVWFGYLWIRACAVDSSFAQFHAAGQSGQRGASSARLAEPKKKNAKTRWKPKNRWVCLAIYTLRKIVDLPPRCRMVYFMVRGMGMALEWKYDPGQRPQCAAQKIIPAGLPHPAGRLIINSRFPHDRIQPQK